MEDKQPGPPPDEKPKPEETKKILEFSYGEMIFEEAFYIDGRMYLRFFIEGEFPYFIECAKAEYLEFQSEYFNRFEEAAANEMCTCSACVIDSFDEVDAIKYTVKFINNETKEEKTITGEYPVYMAYNLVEGLAMSIHETHDLPESKVDDINPPKE